LLKNPNTLVSKFEQKGEIGRLLGYNDELQSYRIWTTARKIVNTKNISLLDYDAKVENMEIPDKSESLEFGSTLRDDEVSTSNRHDDDNDDDSDKLSGTDDQFITASEQAKSDIEVIEEINVVDDRDEISSEVPQEPIPTDPRYSLRERTSRVKLIKYSCVSQQMNPDPKSYKKEISSSDSKQWEEAIQAELGRIEEQDVWEEFYEKPHNPLHTVWVF
jgi:hypothetical protein